ncbi:MAG: ELM1/GtrOC1 family putative glycosyltransferase [Aequoribacter sp.]|jgi:mitochondrial fission protein ELM1|uniref:ELM1/GtrOC1 family putative glycosyltransferase n=1 Tax=Aequoribacter sp. TaxID=2847771 RepID=UPI003C6416C0
MNNSAKQWLYLHDGKPGHVNQLRGLSEAVATKQPNHTSIWLDVTTLSFTQRLFARMETVLPLEAVDVIVAAGHKTHWLALLLGNKLQAHTAVIMRPSWPMAWFDSVIMPKHDANNTPTASNTHLTEGAINALGMQIHEPRNQGLVLLGGQSKHFDWPAAQVTRQVCAIIDSQPDLEWTVADSRRSPELQLANIRNARPGARIQSHKTCPQGWLMEQMQQAERVWVTPDSVSMVYEALSCGADVGFIELPPKAPNRINRSILALIAEGKVSSVTQAATVELASAPLPRLNEAESAAAWLLSRV